MEKTTHFLSPLGCFEIKGSRKGIRSIKLVQTKPCPAGPIPPELKGCVLQLNEYFKGMRKQFDLQLDWEGATKFNRAVWGALQAIPYGHTTSYSAIAEKVGHPTASRAVGLASHHNPLPIVVPCHRVIAKSGELQGYFYGLDMKRQLLELENPLSFARQGSLF